MIQERMAESLALGVDQVNRIVRSASYRYFHFQIDKKNGKKRDIYHPAKELKLLQRWMIKTIILRLPVSPAAAAYEERCSIVANARKHMKNRFLLRMDFANFFPSLSERDVQTVIVNNYARIGDLISNRDDLDVVSNVTCRFGFLTIGAPTSPLLSNRIMEPFDAYWLSFSHEQEVTYTRYADDLFFSCNKPDILSAFQARMTAYLSEQSSPRLRLNTEKTTFSSKKGRRVVTGLKITSENKVSLGRDLKRSLKTRVYLAMHQAPRPEAHLTLRGLLAHAKNVEPDFVARLRAKYDPINLTGLF
jgi:RNA-directed DNA polymerase